MKSTNCQPANNISGVYKASKSRHKELNLQFISLGFGGFLPEELVKAINYQKNRDFVWCQQEANSVAGRVD